MEIFVGISGASGVIYGQRLLQRLLYHDAVVHAAFSRSAATVMKRELDIALDPDQPNLMPLLGEDASRIKVYPIHFSIALPRPVPITLMAMPLPHAVPACWAGLRRERRVA